MNIIQLIAKFESQFPTKEHVFISVPVDKKGWDFTAYFEDELTKLINAAREQGRLENQSKVQKALIALSKKVSSWRVVQLFSMIWERME